MFVSWRRQTLSYNMAALFAFTFAGCQQETPKQRTGLLRRGTPQAASLMDFDNLAPLQVVLAVEGMH
jgi:hypothetical protein